jgi:oxalate decarboxylase
MIDMQPGALRVPHWHPNAWELDYCLEGKAEFWIVGPDNTGHTVMQAVPIGPGHSYYSSRMVSRDQGRKQHEPETSAYV